MISEQYRQGVLDAVAYLSEVFEDVYGTRVLEKLGVKLCSYCQVFPIANDNEYTCNECVFTCSNCKQETSYEKGVSWDTLCDDCAVSIEKG
jgi:hypothetical protein